MFLRSRMSTRTGDGNSMSGAGPVNSMEVGPNMMKECGLVPMKTFPFSVLAPILTYSSRRTGRWDGPVVNEWPPCVFQVPLFGTGILAHDL